MTSDLSNKVQPARIVLNTSQVATIRRIVRADAELASGTVLDVRL